MYVRGRPGFILPSHCDLLSSTGIASGWTTEVRFPMKECVFFFSLSYPGVLDLVCWLYLWLKFFLRLYHSSTSVHASSQFVLHILLLLSLISGLVCAANISLWQWTKHCWKWLTEDRRDLSSERAPHRDNTATFRQNITSGHGLQSELDTTTYWLTDRLS
jgi:hypothetical protein